MFSKRIVENNIVQNKIIISVIKGHVWRLIICVGQTICYIRQIQSIMKNALIMLFHFLSLTISGATYYVSPAGNDSNPGSISQPFFTLNKAWSVVSAGDIVYMRGGNYSYTSTQNLSGKNGTSGNLIKIWAYPGETPIIKKGSGLTSARQSDGSLPNIDFLHLAPGSRLIDAGVDVGLPFSGKAPDLGPFEAQTGSTTPIPVPIPGFISSVVENATPLLIQMTFSLSLTSVVPPNSAFNVLVNSVARTVNSVSISGNTVRLTLASAIKFGDIVTVSYTKPASNPLQTVTGAQASSISNQSIINNLINPAKDAVPGVITMTITPNHVHGIINVLLQYSSTFASKDPAMSPQLIRIVDLSGKLYIEKLLITGISNIRIPINLETGIYNVMIFSGGVQMASQKIMDY